MLSAHLVLPPKLLQELSSEGPGICIGGVALSHDSALTYVQSFAARVGW